MPEPSAVQISVTSEMVRAGEAAYFKWAQFADDPLADKSRTYLTRAEKARLGEDAMVCEVLRAVFGNAVKLPGAYTAAR